MALTTLAGWTVIAAVAISLAYEVVRATARSGVSKYDSTRSVLTSLPLYAGIVVVAGLLMTDVSWVPWVALIMCLALIAVSIFYYSPVMLVARKPATIDHLEDKVYTGLLFVAAALLAIEISGVALS